jgi:predicted secreted protein
MALSSNSITTNDARMKLSGFKADDPPIKFGRYGESNSGISSNEMSHGDST